MPPWVRSPRVKTVQNTFLSNQNKKTSYCATATSGQADDFRVQTELCGRAVNFACTNGTVLVGVSLEVMRELGRRRESWRTAMAQQATSARLLR